MKIAIIGAGGFIGQNLIGYLLKNPDYELIALTRHINKIKIEHKNLKIFEYDVLGEKYPQSLKDCDIAVYLIHMMGQKDWCEKESRAAYNFCKIAKQTKIKKVIYLSGLGDDNKKLSKHLNSRHLTGKILAQNLPLVIELRASVIIGKGSASYDLINHLSSKLKFIILPAWADTKVQPIALLNVLQLLEKAITTQFKSSAIIEMGGPDTLTYRQLLIQNAKISGNKLKILKLKLLPEWPGKYLLQVFCIGQDVRIAKDMLESLKYDMVVQNADKFTQQIKLLNTEQAIKISSVNYY